MFSQKKENSTTKNKIEEKKLDETTKNKIVDQMGV